MKTIQQVHFVIFFFLLYTSSQAQLGKQWENIYTQPDTAYINMIGLLDVGNGTVIKASMATKVNFPNQSNRLLIQKINAAGTLVLDEEFVNPSHDQFLFYSVDKDASGNLYFAGLITVNQSDALWYVASFDGQGQLRWEKNGVEGPFSSGYARKLKVDAAGNVYVSGYVNDVQSYGALVKYDSDGNELWVKKDVDAYANGSDMILANNGDVITCNEHFEITRYSSAGNILWSTPDTAESIYVTPFITESVDGSIYAISFLGYNYSLKKLNASGVFQWNIHNFAEYLAFGDADIKLKTDASGNVYAIGINSMTEQYQTAIFKFDPNGNELWKQPFQTGNANVDMGEVYDLLILPTGNIAIAGTLYSTPNSAIAILDAANGNVLGIDSSVAYINRQVLVYNEAGLFVGGNGDFNTALANFGTSLSIDESAMNQQVDVYPNPFTQFIHIQSDAQLIRYELKDINGKTIKSESLNGNNLVQLQSMAPGIYLLQIFDGAGKSSFKKIIKR